LSKLEIATAAPRNDKLNKSDLFRSLRGAKATKQSHSQKPNTIKPVKCSFVKLWLKTSIIQLSHRLALYINLAN
jgi:hypothetical protein